MKSLMSAVNDGDERLLTKVLPKAVQVPAGKTLAAVRSMAASPNRPTPSDGEPVWTGSVTATVLTAPSEFAPLSVMWLPQQGSALAEKHWPTVLPAAAVSQVLRARVGVPLPPKS